MTLDIDLQVRKGRTFTQTYALTTPVINGDPAPRDLTGATFVMQFRETRTAATSDLTPTFTAIDLAQGQFSFSATSTVTDAMASLGGRYEIRMTLGTDVTTEVEGAYTVVLPVVQ